jgi:hypothetical protein
LALLPAGYYDLYPTLFFCLQKLTSIFTHSSRLLGFDRRGAIRLEDDESDYRHNHYDRSGDALPRYTLRGDGSFYTKTAPRPTAELVQEEKTRDEKR